MALSTQAFWDSFYASNIANEWYFDLQCLEEANDYLNISDTEYPVVLHGGCGACSIARCMKHSYLAEFDFSASILASIRDFSGEVLVIDALHLPFRDEFCDIIIEKGLFDSVTARSCTANAFAHQLLLEYHRVLRHGGIAVIFSIFGPDSEDKDMLGLLSNPNIDVECKYIHRSPAEIPQQNFCFIYLLRKKCYNK